jgi:hypothetical protein
MWALDIALRGVYGMIGLAKSWKGVGQGKEGRGIL